MEREKEREREREKGGGGMRKLSVKYFFSAKINQDKISYLYPYLYRIYILRIRMFSENGCLNNRLLSKPTLQSPPVFHTLTLFSDCILLRQDGFRRISSVEDRERQSKVFCLFGFLTSSSTTRLYSGRVPKLTSDNFTCCHTRDRAWRT